MIDWNHNDALITTLEILNEKVIYYKVVAELEDLKQALECTRLKEDLTKWYATVKEPKRKEVKETVNRLFLQGKIAAPEPAGKTKSKTIDYEIMEMLEIINNHTGGNLLKVKPLKMGVEFRSPITAVITLPFDLYKSLIEYTIIRADLEKELRRHLEKTRRQLNETK